MFNQCIWRIAESLLDLYKTWGEYVKLVFFLAYFLGVLPKNSRNVSCDASCFTLPEDLKSSNQAGMNVLVTG